MNRKELSQEFRESPQLREVAADIHNYHPRAHDGGSAVYLPNKNTIVSLGAERVDRIKYSPDSIAAYNYLRSRLGRQGYIFGGTKDKFEPVYIPDQDIHHHLAHAASAFYPSGFDNAGVLVVDDRGYYKDGYNSTTIWSGNNTDLRPLEMNTEIGFPTQSIGHFYSGITDYLGFGFLEAGKTMGLAAYGRKSEVMDWLGSFVQINSDGTYRIDPTFCQAMRYLYSDIEHGRVANPEKPVMDTMNAIASFLGHRREKTDPITQGHMDTAWAVQETLEQLMLGLAKRTKNLSGSSKLCLAGGVALNSVANGKIINTELFDEVFIQPAAGDDGQALGKLLYRLHTEYGIKRMPSMNTAYLGPEYSEEEVSAVLDKYRGELRFEKKDTCELLQLTAQALSKQHIVGWYQGGSEIGPRALGHRSILADPRSDWMRDHINFKVKNREWFRPFAPSVLLEKANEYFDIKAPSPFMLVVSDVKPDKRTVIPAVMHVDGTARVQTVTQTENGIYYELIKEFGRQTGVPVLLNTSFNVAGEPIIETPEDAIRSFLGTKLDLLVMHNYFIEKKK
jgi:carbamoyltransferase